MRPMRLRGTSGLRIAVAIIQTVRVLVHTQPHLCAVTVPTCSQNIPIVLHSVIMTVKNRSSLTGLTSSGVSTNPSTRSTEVRDATYCNSSNRRRCYRSIPCSARPRPPSS
ncbi:hypothetical protein EDB89DRAFT_627667 [Lactarius sanguifluus]|nr:hypothetical protein EDB89DRAFT_627667 [Lactarius sanguifluus]